MRRPSASTTSLVCALAFGGCEARECYATIVYGSEAKHACLAAVLGASLRVVDPARPRVALVSNVSGSALEALGEAFEVARTRWRGAPGRKVDLFAGPLGCDRLVYMDADCVPTARPQSVRALWAQLRASPTSVVATRQGRVWENYKHDEGCFNGGFLAVRRDPGIRERYVKYTKTFTRQRGAWSKVDPRQRIGTKSIPCHGTDQGFLNLAVGPKWTVANFSVHFATTCRAAAADVVHAGRGGLAALLARAPPRAGGGDPPRHDGDWCGLWWGAFATLSDTTRALCAAALRPP